MSPTKIEIRHPQDIINLKFKDIKAITDPLLRAIALAFLKKRIQGDWYQVEESEEVQSFDFAFLGFNGKPQTHQEGLWLKRCRECGKKIPVLIVRKQFHLKEPIPNRFGEYKEKVETQSSLLTLECGKIYFDGFLSADDLAKRRNHNGN